MKSERFARWCGVGLPQPGSLWIKFNEFNEFARFSTSLQLLASQLLLVKFSVSEGVNNSKQKSCSTLISTEKVLQQQ